MNTQEFLNFISDYTGKLQILGKSVLNDSLLGKNKIKNKTNFEIVSNGLYSLKDYHSLPSTPVFFKKIKITDNSVLPSVFIKKVIGVPPTADYIGYSKIVEGSWGTSEGSVIGAGNPEYDFTITEDTMISIILDSKDAVPYTILAESDNTVINVDSGGKGLNMYLSAGNYKISAGTVSSNQSGNFQLRVAFDKPVVLENEPVLTKEQIADSLFRTLTDEFNINTSNNLYGKYCGDHFYIYSTDNYTGSLENIVEVVGDNISVSDSNLDEFNATIKQDHITELIFDNIVNTIKEFYNRNTNTQVNTINPSFYNSSEEIITTDTDSTTESHEQNTDTKLAEGTSDEVTAKEIRTFLDNDLNLKDLDDVDTTNLNNNYILYYDSATETFKFKVESGGSGSSGHTIQDDGVSLTARLNLDFQKYFNLSDDSGNNSTEINIDLTALFADPAFSTGIANHFSANPREAFDVTVDDSSFQSFQGTNVQAVIDFADVGFTNARGTEVRPGTGIVSINSGDNTKFDLTATIGQIRQSGGTFAQISASAVSAVSVTDISASSIWLYYDVAGVLQQQTTAPTASEFRDKLFLARLASNGTNLVAFERVTNPSGQYANSIRDLYEYIDAAGVPLQKGLDITGNANLTFNRASGSVFEFGASSNTDSPNTPQFAAATPANLFIQTRSTTIASAVTNINVTQYDNGGVLSTLTNNRFVGHRVYFFTSGNHIVQLGQTQYQSMDDAEAGVGSEPYVVNPSTNNGVFLGWWIVKKNTTDLTNTLNAKWIPYSIGGQSAAALAGSLIASNNLSDLDDPNAARTNLGVAIGADVQQFDDELTALSLLPGTPNTIPRFTGPGSADTVTFLDEDSMASNSDAGVPSQQSVKAYVDNNTINEVVDDLTPQLGGDLDTNNNNITGHPEIDGQRPIITESTTARTLSLSDAGNFIITTNGSDVTITIPTNATAAFPIGIEIDFFQKGAGALTISATSSVILNGTSSGNETVLTQYGGISIKKIDTNEWIAVGKI